MSEVVKSLIDQHRLNIKRIARDALDQIAKAGNTLNTSIFKELGLGTKDLTPDDFWSVVKVLTQNAPETVLKNDLLQAGFAESAIAKWFDKTEAPEALLLKPVLLVMLATAIKHDPTSPQILDLHQLANRTDAGLGGAEGEAPKWLPLLDTPLTSFPWWKRLKVRLQNGLLGERIVLLGELLAMSEKEFLKIPNLGHKSLTKVEEVLAEHLGCGLGCLVEHQAKQYNWMAKTRTVLESFGESPLYLEWESTTGAGTTSADPALVEALRAANITMVTQLATAPKDVIDSICGDNVRWREQLSKMIGQDGFGWYKPELFMRVPPHLRGRVIVYKQ